MKKQKRRRRPPPRPKQLMAVSTKSPKIFSLTSPPPASIIQKCANLFGSNGGFLTPPVLDSKMSPFKILSRSSGISSFVKRIKGNASALIHDLLHYILEYGGLIRTNDPAREYVFDRERFLEISLASTQGKSALSEYNQESRLRELLGISAPVQKEDPITKPEADLKRELPPMDEGPEEEEEPETPPTEEEEEDEEELEEPQPLTSEEIRTYVSVVAKDGLNGLLALYPMMDDLPKLLGLLAVHSAKGREEALDEVLGDLVRLIHVFRDRLETEALEIIEDLDTNTRESNSTELTSKMIEAQIRVLQDKKKTLEPMQSRLSAAKLAQDELLEHLEFTVIEQDLQVRLEVMSRSAATSEDVPKIEAAIEKAEAKAEELRDYIDYLADLLSPIKAEIDQLNRRINALRLLKQAFQAKDFEDPTLRPAPEYDEEALLDWRTADPEEPDTSSPPEKDPEDKPAASPSEDNGDLPKIELTEDFILALFRMLGQRTSLRIGNVLKKLGLIKQSQIGVIFTAAKQLSDRNQKNRRLMYMGAFHGQATYRTAKHVSRDIVNEFVPPEIQRAILEEFDMAEPKP